MILVIIFIVCASLAACHYTYKKEHEMISAVSTFLTMLIAIVAASVAYYQLGESKISSAKSIYKDYIALAFANPDLSAASYPIDHPRYRDWKLDSENYEKYENYVAFLLFSAEEILDRTGENQAWCLTLRDQFTYHALYLTSGNLHLDNYSSKLYPLLDEAVAMYEQYKIIEIDAQNKQALEQLKKLNSMCNGRKLKYEK